MVTPFEADVKTKRDAERVLTALKVAKEKFPKIPMGRIITRCLLGYNLIEVNDETLATLLELWASKP